MELQIVDYPVRGIGQRFPVVYKRETRELVISVWIGLRMVNHRTDRPEHIVGCSVELKRRYLLLWHKTIVNIPVRVNHDKTPWKEVFLEPMSRSHTVALNALSAFTNIELPKRSDLFIVLDLVGPIKKMERLLQHIERGPASQ